jgi:sterol O-acyltransferase
MISEPDSDSDSIRESVPVKLQETDKAGQYLLTAEDADLLQEILKHKDQPSEKGRFKFQELTFTRQLSTFHNLGSTSPQFHGFFVLFWMGVGLMLLKLAAHNWRVYGSIWGKNEIVRLMMDKDVLVLGVTDLVLCWSTGFCLLLQRAILNKYLRWNGLGWLIQNVSFGVSQGLMTISLLISADLANDVPWRGHLVVVPPRLAVDTHGLHRLALSGHADETAQLLSL